MKEEEDDEQEEEEEGVSVLLISLKTGSIGLNLAAANHVILCDPWWNPAVEDQAIERVHRIGQTKVVEVWRIICKNTIEEKMLDLHKQKKEMIEKALRCTEAERTKESFCQLQYLLN